jgi:hypothetical protein
MTEQPYASAVFDLLDRDDQSVKKFIAYPTNRVVLRALQSEANPSGHPVRTFVVNDKSEWEEVS